MINGYVISNWLSKNEKTGPKSLHETLHQDYKNMSLKRATGIANFPLS